MSVGLSRRSRYFRAAIFTFGTDKYPDTLSLLTSLITTSNGIRACDV